MEISENFLIYSTTPSPTTGNSILFLSLLVGEKVNLFFYTLVGQERFEVFVNTLFRISRQSNR